MPHLEVDRRARSAAAIVAVIANLAVVALIASACSGSTTGEGTEAAADGNVEAAADGNVEAAADGNVEAAADVDGNVEPDPPDEASEPDQLDEPDPPDEASEPGSVGDFDAPGELELSLPLEPGEPGSIIDVEVVHGSAVSLRRILYHSTSAEGDDVAVSGFVALPTGEAPAGGWPLIAWAHGTTGLGDACAPSANAERDVLAQALANFGYAVVATDYEGLGTPGTHPYVVGPSEAHSVLDSVRAVHELDLPVTDEWIVFGHSQGGHAAMFTAQLHATYAPELDLIGAIAGAPPSQMVELSNALIGSDFQGYLVMTAAGLAAAYRELSLDDMLTPAALDLIDVVETGCTADIFSVFNPLEYDEVTKVDNPFELPGWGAAIAAQDTNRAPTLVPLLIIHGEADEQIPIETSAALFDQLCAFPDQGPTVRNTYPEQTHAGVLTTFAAVPDLLAWAAARFAGEPAPNACP